MELKHFSDSIKKVKLKNSLLDLTYNILQLEELLIESPNKGLEINQLGKVLISSFLLINENKIEINNKEINDLDLDNWKNSIGKYKLKNTISQEIYLYTLRNSLKNLIKSIDPKDEINIKTYLFELIIKTFLYIDFINLSIDHILLHTLKTIPQVIEKAKKED